MERARKIVMATLVSSLYVLCATYALSLVGGCEGCKDDEEPTGLGDMSASAHIQPLRNDVY